MTVRFTPAQPREQSPLATPAYREWYMPDGQLWTSFHRVAEGFLLRFPALADFLVDADARSAIGWPAPGTDLATLEHLFLNQVLPLALSHQGERVLHGSAVVLQACAVAFLGSSGMGKSTLAAGFAVSGAPFLTDDGLRLVPQGRGYIAMPSHPSIRLWQDSERALVPDEAHAMGALPYTAKARYLAGEHIPFCSEPRPLAAFFHLAREGAAEPLISPMAPAQALMSLVSNSFLLDTQAPAPLSTHFAQLAELVERVPHYRLDFPRSYARLAEVRQAIDDHLRRQRSGVVPCT